MASPTDCEKGRNDKHCCVPYCNGNGRRNPELSFHHIPSAPDLRKAWILAIRRDPGPNFTITGQTVVCSRHFQLTDFKWTPLRKTLKPGSVPSIFEWREKKTPRRGIVKHQLQVRDQESAADDVDSVESVPDENMSVSFSTCSENGNSSHADKQKIEELERTLKERDTEIKNLQRKLDIERFGVERFSHDNAMMLFYTGFVSMAVFLSVFDYFKPAANSMNSCYYKACEKVNQIAIKRQRNMLLVDEFFMFLCRLKCSLMEQDLAVRFNIHISTVSRKIISWVNFLYFALGSVNIWPKRQQIDEKMPDQFKLLYPSTRVIIDCTEIKTERPSSLALGSKCYSSYKSSYTWKGLVGIAPHGALTFVSNLYTGSMSDIEITKLSGLIGLLETGDSIMADKGFLLNKVLEGTGVSVNTPPFLSNHGQFSKQEVEETQIIARLRIHIERHIRRVKEYHLFDGVIPLTMVGTINQLWTVANLLTLFRGALVKDWK